MAIEVRFPKKFQGDQRERGMARKAIEHFFKTVAKDRLLLLAIVAGGLSHWMKVSAKSFKGFRIDDLQRETIFRTLQEHAGDNPKAQLDALTRAELVNLKMDKLKGLARFIDSEEHLDEVLERNLPDESEREAIRQQMLIILRNKGTIH